MKSTRSLLSRPETKIPATIEPTIPPIGKRLFFFRSLVPFVGVSIILLLAARQFNLSVTPAKVLAIMAQANLWLFVSAFIAFYMSLWIRTLRWKVLLENVGYEKKRGVLLPNLLHLTKILYLSWFVNVIVPAKLGDGYRSYLLHKQEAKISGFRTFGTIMAERILDLVVLVFLFLASVLVSLNGRMPLQLEQAMYICLVLAGGMVGGLGLLRKFPEQVKRVFPQRVRERYDQFQTGLLGSFRRLGLLAGLTLAAWIVESLRFLFIALAIDLFSGNPVHIFSAALFVALGESLLTAVPLTIGGVGLVEAGMFALTLLFIPPMARAQNMAGAAIALDRIVSLGSILLFGGILFFWSTMLSSWWGIHRRKAKGGAV